jgi:hypothetical protein
MKVMKKLIQEAAIVAAIAVVQSVQAGGPIMAGPRALEEFPWLGRQVPSEHQDPERVPASIKCNRALVSSPRVLEEYPQLTRIGYSPRSNAESIELAQVLRNAALANSPRTREEFPCLDRGSAAATERKNSFSPTLLGNVSPLH